ncbi:MAG: tetratricopeptide repeat protein [Planctomycetota bacterium]
MHNTFSRSLIRRAGLRCCLAAILAALCGLATPAAAQLTTANLIGDSVSSPENARYNDVGNAIERFNNRDVLSARNFLEKAKQDQPKLPPVGVMLAKMYLLSGNGAQVRPALEQTINDDADDPEPYLMLAESNLRARNTIEADALFDKSVGLIDAYDSNLKRKRRLAIRAYSGRASVAESRGKWAAAEADLRAWIEQAPYDATARTRLGQALCMLERTEEGFQEFVKAKKEDENRANPYVMVAVTLERMGQQAEALEQFKKGYQESGREETTLLTYAQALINADQLAKAVPILTEARAAAPNSFNVWLFSGVAQRMSGDVAQAERSLVQALAIRPGSREAYGQLAQILSSSEDPQQRTRGLQYAGTLAKLYPDNADASVTLAWALYQNNRSREATATLRKALQSGTNGMGADARVLLAKILIATNQTDNARRVLQSAMTDNRGIFVQRKEAEKLLADLQ